MEIPRLKGTIPFDVRLGLVEYPVIQCIGRQESEDGLTKDVCRRITVTPVVYILYPLSIDVESPLSTVFMHASI